MSSYADALREVGAAGCPRAGVLLLLVLFLLFILVVLVILTDIELLRRRHSAEVGAPDAPGQGRTPCCCCCCYPRWCLVLILLFTVGV